METDQLKNCPICLKDLPLSKFGRNAYYDTRGAMDGRSLYCASCVRLKRNAEREALKEYKAAKKRRMAQQAEIAAVDSYKPLADGHWPTGCLFKLSPVEKVLDAIRRGHRTQAEIRSETKLGKDEIGDAIANLLLWTKEIRTMVIDGTRMYFLNRVEVKPESRVIPVAVPFFDIARKLGAPSVKGEKRIKRVA